VDATGSPGRLFFVSGALCLVLVGAMLTVYGTWLIATVGNEFEPRGSVGVAAVILGLTIAVAGAVTLAAALRRRRPPMID
jgi:hypothetical protein